MIDKILKGLVDLFYRTKSVRSKFEHDNPEERVLAADGTKGIITEEESDIQRGTDWVVSKRAVILLTNKKIKCDTWEIPLENIKNAELVKVKSLYGTAQILKIKTNEKNYQFGMQINPEWTNQDKLQLDIKDGKIKTSFFSVVIRIVLIGYLIYWIIDKFIK
jgi:hypothetical protein